MASRCDFVFFLIVMVCALRLVTSSCPVDADLPCRCPSSTIVDCSNANLTDVPANISSVNMTIHQLNLQHNMIKTLADDAFQGLYQLTEINLSHNEIEEIGASFNTLPHLQTLQLNDNQISSIGQLQFQMLSSLVSLDLKNNALKTLEVGVFNGLTNLTTLNLASNEIHTIDAGVFEDQGKLKTLFLDSNNISYFSENQLQGLNSLVDLSMEDNQIETLSSQMQTFTSIKMINLKNNPLVCDKQMAWIADWRKDHSIQGTCAEPEKLKNKTLSNVTEVEFIGHTGQVEGNVTVNMTFTTAEPTYVTDITKKSGVEMWVIIVIIVILAVVIISFVACAVLTVMKRRQQKSKPDPSKQTRIFYNHKYDSVKQSGQRSKDIYADLTTEL